MGVIIIIGKQISFDVKSKMHFYQMKYVFLTIHLRACQPNIAYAQD